MNLQLKNRYIRDDFLSYLDDFLPNFKKDVRKVDKTSLKITNDVVYLGEDPQLKLAVFELKHASTFDARVTLAFDGFRLLKNHGINRALIAYTSADDPGWRLSLVTITLEADKKRKLKSVFSNPRRFSFFLGPQAKTNTPDKFLNRQGPIKDFDELQKRFSVEVVNKDFYREIAELFTKLVGGQRKIGGKKQTFEAILQLPSKTADVSHQLYSEFAVRLIGRIVFCWFLKQKQSKDKVPLISDALLNRQVVKDSYYHSVLEKLFFEMLNKESKERSSDLPADADKVPYLNGGLFEPHSNDYYEGQPNFVLKVPDQWFIDLFEVLERYNFTIDENTSTDIELSIDPEMLGRIFENLLAEINPETGASARKNTGSYYTPRTIVDYMVQTSLKEYLKSKFPAAKRQLLDKDSFLKLCQLDDGKLLEYIQNHFHKSMQTSLSYFEDEGFTDYIISHRIIAKLRGLDAFRKMDQVHKHAEIDKRVWQAFLSDEVKVVDRLYGRIKNLKLQKRYSWVTMCLVFEYQGRMFAAFFSPLLTNELSLSTIYAIDERRYSKMKQIHNQLDMDAVFELQKKSFRRDADLPHTGTNPVAAQRFSTLRKLLSDPSILDEEMRVKLGSRDMVSREIEEILAGTGDAQTEEETRRRIVDALDELKVLDPACGSGAFPMGVLQKVVQILQEVDPDGKLWLEKQLAHADPEFRKDIEKKYKSGEYGYIRKLGLIRRCIYGVDIQPIATELSRLRCFLTLIVDQVVDDQEENRGIKALPNLDFKFISANSLIGLPKDQMYENGVAKRSLFEDNVGIERLKALRDKYFTASGEEREELKKQFQKVKREIYENIRIQGKLNLASRSSMLTNWDPFGHDSTGWFDPEWMFGVKDGFDIVIANPPYVGEKRHKEIFREIRRSTLERFYLRKMDLFYFFFHLALDMGKGNSQIAFITTNYYLTADGARKLRQDLKERSAVKELLNLNELKIFKSALGQHNILTLLTKTNRVNDNTRNKDSIVKTCITRRVGTATPEILLSIVGWDDTETDYYLFPVDDLYEGNEFYIRIEGSSQNSKNLKQIIINKVQSEGEKLGSLCKVSQGLLTGIDKITDRHITTKLIGAKYKNNGVYVLNKEEYKNLQLKSSEKKLLKAFFKNSDIKRYYAGQTPNSYVLYLTRNLDLKNYPGLKTHIQKYEKPIKARSKDRGEMQAALRMGKWWVIFAARDDKVFQGPKIISPQRSYKNTFAYNEAEWFASADVYYITEKNSNIKLKYVLSLLNSKLFYLWFYLRGKKKGEMLELLYTPLMEVPIKKISEKEQWPFIEIVNKILAVTNSSDYLTNAEKLTKVEDYEKQIDQMVYELYGLTDEEKKVVEGKN